ncbi:MAG TPA: polysaccharide deacetylase family protein [Candidatus Eremiobacteraceae bacterium]|nr:polysaccharide deacetylase family protein [Candidatus Eremiobacteraceae bacterium]
MKSDVRRPAPNAGRAALTFDDGPNSDGDVTMRLLDILRCHGDVKATFFLIGEFVDESPELVRKIKGGGHSIGNHTYTHPDLSSCSRERIRSELLRCDAAIKRALGDRAASVSLFRPPYGSAGGHVAEVAAELDLKLVGWTAAGLDWECDLPNGTKPLRADQIYQNVSKQLDMNEMTEIVLLHDGCPRIERGRPWRADRTQTLLAVEHLLQKYANLRNFVPLA